MRGSNCPKKKGSGSTNKGLHHHDLHGNDCNLWSSNQPAIIAYNIIYISDLLSKTTQQDLRDMVSLCLNIVVKYWYTTCNGINLASLHENLNIWFLVVKAALAFPKKQTCIRIHADNYEGRFETARGGLQWFGRNSIVH